MNSSPQLACRAATASDWPRIRDIYAAGIEAGDATFESAPPESWEKFAASKVLVIVCEDGLGVLGWAGATRASQRDVYRGVVEHSVYVDPGAAGRGVGTALMASLLEAAHAAGMWTVQATVFPENLASLALHRKFGFREVGRRERIALMPHGPLAGTWRDTVLLELRFGHRSE
ncbi:MAG: N-acetyltransferase [Sinomonas sp.]|nr:N-acetyltransferase [Sinomonas sp.]